MWTSKRELKRRNEWQALELERLINILDEHGIEGNWLLPGQSKTIPFVYQFAPAKPKTKKK